MAVIAMVVSECKALKWKRNLISLYETVFNFLKFLLNVPNSLSSVHGYTY